MRILLLGATGQIGHALARHFAAAPSEFSLTILKRDTSGPVFPSGVEILSAKGFDKAVFAKALAYIDHVVYAIGSPEQWTREPGFFRDANVGILEEFLAALSERPAISLTYVSTFEVFKARDGVISETGETETRGATPYYQSMIDALAKVKAHARDFGRKTICFHPAAVYGGRNTGKGITNFLLDVKRWNFLGTPSILPGRFPIVHVDSLASAMLAALGASRFDESYVVSDAYVSLKEIARSARTVSPGAYQPLELPAGLVRLSAHAMDWMSDHITRRPPILSAVQVKYITESHAIDSAKARRELGWTPMPLEEGIRRLYASG